jgi:hypothetical protein
MVAEEIARWIGPCCLREENVGSAEEGEGKEETSGEREEEEVEVVLEDEEGMEVRGQVVGEETEGRRTGERGAAGAAARRTGGQPRRGGARTVMG